MKTIAIFCAVLATTAIAQPHQHGNKRRHVHGKHHNKRAFVTEWVTEVAYVTEYIDATTTVYVGPGEESTTAVPASSVPAQFFEPANSPSYTTLSTSTKPAPVASPIQESIQQVPAPASPSSTSTPPPAPQIPTPQPVEPSTSVDVPPAPAPVPTTSSAPPAVEIAPQPAATQASTDSSSSSGGESYTGDLTYYTVGMGACGEDDSGKDMTENIVALSHLMMGTQSNGNPYCGRKIKISVNGKSTTATVRDKCMGCAIDAIDVSEKCFLEIFDSLGVGRSSVEWSFIN